MNDRGQPWTDEETKRLVALFGQKLSYSAIARKMRRSRDSVTCKLHRIGLVRVDPVTHLRPLSRADLPTARDPRRPFGYGPLPVGAVPLPPLPSEGGPA